MKFEKYKWCLNELLQASCLSPFGPVALFKFAPGEFVRKNLAALGKLLLRCSTTYIPVGDLDRSPFSALASLLRPTTYIHVGVHSYCYASADDQPTLFARFPLIFVPFIQYAG